MTTVIYTRQKVQTRKTGHPSLHCRRCIAVAGLVLMLMLPMFFVESVFAASTYSIKINTSWNDINNGVSVPITMDGIATGFNTPHTFSGLMGTHNFTVPYEDSDGHLFMAWDNTVPTDSYLTTMTVSSGGTYWAFYDTTLPRDNDGANSVYPAERRCYITPTDPAVVAIAENKSWSGILNWVASHITYDHNCNIWQFPNETLTLGSGQCREYSTLAVSMLIARGYTAYVVYGEVSAISGIDTSISSGHDWIAIEINGTLYHFEPQDTGASQPTATQFTGYTPKYFFNNTELLPAMASYDPPATDTYDVTINTKFNDVFNGVHVPIFEDGLPTGFSTPYTFVGLEGSHNFTVPYNDDAGHPFICWGTSFPGDTKYPTITVTSGGSFTAFYDTGVSLAEGLHASEYHYLITPYDSAVRAAASNKVWNEILDFAATVPYASNTVIQFPNQTLASGTRYYVDRASLCCSMLRSQGYTAYMVRGSTSSSTDSWVVLQLNGVFYHLNTDNPWEDQATIDFSSYQADYYVDENGIYPPGVSQNPPATLVTPSASPTPSPTSVPSTTTSPTSTPTATASPSSILTPSPPVTTPTPTSTATPSQTSSPSRSVSPSATSYATDVDIPMLSILEGLTTYIIFVVVVIVVVVAVLALVLFLREKKPQQQAWGSFPPPPPPPNA
jgi:hypothetical protein